MFAVWAGIGWRLSSVEQVRRRRINRRVEASSPAGRAFAKCCHQRGDEHIITRLHKTQGEVLGNYQSRSSVWCPGCRAPKNGIVRYTGFYHDHGQLNVGGLSLNINHRDGGDHCAVRLP